MHEYPERSWMLAVDYVLGYVGEDRPTRFHDIVEVEKANIMTNAAVLKGASNPGLAEWFMNLIDFSNEVGRKELNYHKSLGSLNADVKSISSKNRLIEHIHANCYDDIVSSWELPTDETANIELLERFKQRYPKEADNIDILIKAVSRNESLEDFFGVHTFYLNL